MKRVLSNYRPISVLTFFSKVFEKAISKYPLAFHDFITIHYVNLNSVFKKNTQPAMRFVSIVERISTALTLSDPGYFRQLTIRGGALKAPPYDLENYLVNLHHIIHVNFTRCFWHDPIGIFQKIAILTILQRFQNKK